MVASWLSNWNPVPSFPEYHGPYAVGTVDVEIPSADLPGPCGTPEGAAPTIAFRLFYPCTKPSSAEHTRPVRWISQPQKPTLAALMQFLGLQNRTAGALSYLAQSMYWIKINAYRNAKILDVPTSSRRWPVTFFSHGLAGSRNGYSYICGDMASNGMIVVAMDHRDGSSPIQYVRATKDTEAHIVDTVKISHEATSEVFEGRDKQLRIRLWEISMAYEALKKIDAGEKIENLDENTSHKRKERVEVLQQFSRTLDIHHPGKVCWSGHSFGASTIIQLLKSLYHSSERPANAGKALMQPNVNAAILSQITPESPTILLDMWCLPLKSPEQTFLWNKALPSYASQGPQGDNVLSALSQGFYNWGQNLEATKHIVAPPANPGRQSTSRVKSRANPAWAQLRDDSPSKDSGYASQDSHSAARDEVLHEKSVAINHPSERSKGPHMFFVEQSQHFNHSDYGVLFPWLTRRFAKADDPERILELNVRAIVQVLREGGVEVAGNDDREILATDPSIRRWVPIAMHDRHETSHQERVDPLIRTLSNTSNNDTTTAMNEI